MADARCLMILFARRIIESEIEKEKERERERKGGRKIGSYNKSLSSTLDRVS